MEEDEDVVFENSALYRHLKDAGYSEEDISPETVSSAYKLAQNELHKEQAEQKREAEEKRKRQKVEVTAWAFCKGLVKWLLGYQAYHEEIRQKHQTFMSDVTIDLLDSPIFEEEDYDYVDNYFVSAKERAVDYTESVGEFVKHLILAIIVLGYGIFRVIQIKKTGTASMHMWSIDVLTVTFMCVALLPALFKIFAVERLSYKFRRCRGNIGKLFDEFHYMRKLHKKSLRMIQEAELVSRGFTMVNSKTPIERMEQSSIQATQRQCPILRKEVYHSARDLLLEFKEATREIIQQYPNSNDLEQCASYLANIPLEEYGPCVNLTGEEKEPELREATDNYSITALKAVVNLYNVHLSEFVRVWNTALLARSFVYKHTNFFNIVDKALGRQKVVRTKLTGVEQCYQQHQSSDERRENSKKKREHKNSSEFNPTYTAVHSLKLHLQAALKRVNEIEEKIDPEKSTPNADKDSVTSCLSELQVAANEIEASKDCLEEASNRLSKILKTEDGTEETEKSSQETQEGDDDKEQMEDPIPLFDPSAVPKVVDQVFEAYIDAEHVESDTGNDPMLSLEEKEKKRQEKQEALRMLKELKTVIKVRAQDREERERRALRRMRGEDSDGEDEEEEETQPTNVDTPDNPPETQVEDIDSGVRKRNIGSSGDPNQESHYLTGSNDHFIPPKTSELDAKNAKFCDKNELAWDDLKNHPYKPPRDRIEVGEEDEDTLESRKARLSKVAEAMAGGFPFTANVAALAAARGRTMGMECGDTFGDGSDSEGVIES